MNAQRIVLHEIETLLKAIELCDTFDQAAPLFEALTKIQGDLAYMAFADNIELPRTLMKIVRDCDRLDSEIVRRFIFEEVKKGTYVLDSDKFLWYD